MTMNEKWLGRKRGKLTVIEVIKVKGSGALVRCKCECGNERIIRAEMFRKGKCRRDCGDILHLSKPTKIKKVLEKAIEYVEREEINKEELLKILKSAKQ